MKLHPCVSTEQAVLPRPFDKARLCDATSIQVSDTHWAILLVLRDVALLPNLQSWLCHRYQYLMQT